MEILNIINFIEEVEKLKSVVRTAWTSSGRRESTAEHSWRLALFACVIAQYLPELNISKVIIMSLIHDIGEIYEGDISAALEPDKDEKYNTEYQAAHAVFTLLSNSQAKNMMDIWVEYNDNLTPEAKLVKALDKAETIIQHNQGNNPKDFNYEFNLEYGKNYFEYNDILKQLRVIIDEKTKQKI